MPGYNNTYKDNLILVISADHKGAKNAIAELNDYLMATQKLWRLPPVRQLLLQLR